MRVESARRWLLMTTVLVALAWCCVGTGVASPTGRPVPDEEYFGLILLPRDEQGVEVPIRNGDETLGFAKACTKHNFCSLMAMSSTIRGSGDKQSPEGPRVVYRGHVVGDGYDVVLRVVVDTSTFSRRGAPLDGRPIGVITAYCEGSLRCPDVLNEM